MKLAKNYSNPLSEKINYLAAFACLLGEVSTFFLLKCFLLVCFEVFPHPNQVSMKDGVIKVFTIHPLRAINNRTESHRYPSNIRLTVALGVKSGATGRIHSVGKNIL